MRFGRQCSRVRICTVFIGINFPEVGIVSMLVREIAVCGQHYTTCNLMRDTVPESFVHPPSKLAIVS